MDMHEGTIQSEQNEKNASVFQDHELEYIVHVEDNKEPDEDLFTSIIEDFFLTLDGNSPKPEVCEQHDEARYAAMISLESHEETHFTWHEVVVEEATSKGGTSKKSSDFVLSRGRSIRHDQAWLEANKMSKVTLEPEHEETNEHGIKHVFVLEKRQPKFIDPFWSSSTYDQLEETSAFVHFFHGVVYHLMVLLFVLHLLLMIYDHVKHGTLLKKGI